MQGPVRLVTPSRRERGRLASLSPPGLRFAGARTEPAPPQAVGRDGDQASR
jgi:hypothetical protein